MGGRNQTTWKKGQSGNPKGRPKLLDAHREATNRTAALVGAVIEAPELGTVKTARFSQPAPTGKDDGEPRVRAGLWALTPKAVLALGQDLDNGGDRRSTAARYILDQTIGKPTETVKHTGEGGQVKVVLEYVDKQLVVNPPPMLPPKPDSDPPGV